jgi:predicted RNase H-like HicB family nuclease
VFCDTLRAPTNMSGTTMDSKKYVYWQEDGMWLGYLDEYPDYMTQGETLADLQEHLKDVYQELAGGFIPHVRRVAELQVA